MKLLRKASYQNYVNWYLARESRKPDISPYPTTDEARRHLMENEHGGKLRDWFPRADWWMVLIEHKEEFERLVYLCSDWTRNNSLTRPGSKNFRLLRKVAANAIQSRHIEAEASPQMKSYFQQLKEGRLTLCGNDRLVLRTLVDSERNDCP